MKKAFDKVARHIKKDQDSEDRNNSKNENAIFKSRTASEIREYNPNNKLISETSAQKSVSDKDTSSLVKSSSLNKSFKSKAWNFIKSHKKEHQPNNRKESDTQSDSVNLKIMTDDLHSFDDHRYTPLIDRRTSPNTLLNDTFKNNSTNEPSIDELQRIVASHAQNITEIADDAHFLESRYTEFTVVVQEEVRRINESFAKLNEVMDALQLQIYDRLDEHDDQITVYMDKTGKLEEQLAQQQNTINAVDMYFGDLERKWGSPVLRTVIPIMVFILVAISAIWQKFGHRQFLIPSGVCLGLWILKKYTFG